MKKDQGTRKRVRKKKFYMRLTEIAIAEGGLQEMEKDSLFK